MHPKTIALADAIQNTIDLRAVFKPQFFRLTDDKDFEKWETLVQSSHIRVSDELHGQLRELVKLKNPNYKFSNAELDEAAHDYLKGAPTEEYGVWVFYPWLNHVVHILDETEFREVRTNRNQFKITPAERDLLSTKKIGVLGLSVGQSVALALSMEKSFGELRIADFDILELSNLNRIRSGVQDLGTAKTVSTARQIAEIDPFLNITCFHEGLTKNNLDSFFLENGKLDILIDECDGLDVKILARNKARELQIPVVMETSDRGMLDIERFDLEPERSIFHGLLDHLNLDPEKLKDLTNEEKIPYILPILGIDTMSDRLKASMLEVEQSITTWPQLASDVILGGAISANVCRRISLNQFQSSGRYFVDLNEIISDKNSYNFSSGTVPLFEKTALQNEKSEEILGFSAKTFSNQIDLDEAQIKSLIKAAIAAPSGGNSQPWKWIYENKNLYLQLDRSRANSFLDYKSSGAFLALGAAAENLILRAHDMGFEITKENFPEKNNENIVAAFRFFHPTSAPAQVEARDHDHLSDAINIRLTNRLIRKRQKVERERLNKIYEMARSISGAEMRFIDDCEDLVEMGELIAKIDRVLITHPEGHQGFVSEIRWNDDEAQKTKDGVDIATIDLSGGEAAGFRIAKNWSVVKTLNNWGGGSVFEKLSRKCVAGASAVCLITMPADTSADFFEAGRSIERAWLFSNKMNIAFQPLTAFTFILHRLMNGKGEGLSSDNVRQLNYVKDKFYRLFNLKNEYPVFLFRLLIAEEPKVKSLRRSVDDVLVIRKNK